MTRIHNLFLFRARRKPIIQKIDSVSFDSFHNVNIPEKLRGSRESSLSDTFSPHAKKVDKYERFSINDVRRKCSTSSAFAVLVFLLLAVFFILPIFYLLYCSGLILAQADYIQSRSQVQQTSQKLSFNRTQDIYKQNVTLLNKLPEPPKSSSTQCQVVKNEDKLDCYPQGEVTQETCESRGCCWQPVDNVAPLGVPYCFYPSGFPSYYYLNISKTAFGLVAFLKRDFKTSYPGDVEILKLTVKYETATRLHIKISDPLNHRFEPPYPEIPIVDRAATNLQYELILDSAKPGFKILRKSDSTVIFDALQFGNMIFSNYFLQLSGQLPSSYIYGIGEHQTNFMLSTNWTRYTLFNRDGPPEFNQNLYGSHPFYMVLENSSNAHGVFLLNSNAMDILLQPSPIITYRTIGGVLDFFFFLGPTPTDVVAQYTDLIGRPLMPPYWGLGFHLCRYGYKTLARTKFIMERNINAGIPLDTQWNDLDYMNNSNDFTYDKIKFEGLPTFVEDLHKNGMHYIPLVDPGVSGSEPIGTYPPYDEGVKMDIFVKNSSDQIFIGKVWNTGSTVWPDFTHPNTVDYWTLMLKDFHNEVAIDGAWIDMNEPSNFYSGQITGCPDNILEHPPYVPDVVGGVLNYNTLCMTSKHYAGLHYDIHNMYGFTEAIVTNFALSEIRGKRPMIISRSSFAGIGHYSGHWSGDIWSTWSDMRYTIPQILAFSLYGVPLLGADICGFNGNSTASLCNRWMQLGAFYPFSRNHNTDDGIDQDPVAFGDLVIKSSRKALLARYSLLPYLYTLFWSAHVDGYTVTRPLFFEFTNDAQTYGIDTQFLWGSALMIIPVLKEEEETVTGYLPKGIWYNFYTRASTLSKGEYFNISAPLDTIPLFVRGGYIIPQQSALQTTTASRQTPLQLLVALDEEGSASGKLYWDDGDSLNSYEEKRYSLSTFTADKNVLRVANVYRQELPPNLGNVTVLGVQSTVSSVSVNGQDIQSFSYDPVQKVLSIEKLDLDFKNSMVFSWK